MKYFRMVTIYRLYGL